VAASAEQADAAGQKQQSAPAACHHHQAAAWKEQACEASKDQSCGGCYPQDEVIDLRE